MLPILKVLLLRNRPIVLLNDQELDIPDASLDLLIYLVVENKTSHDREELAQVLYGARHYKENLRKSALHNIPKEIRDVFIRQERRNVLGFDNSQIWVDVHQFSILADMTPEHQTLAWSKHVHPQLVAAYELYEDDFLKGYYPNLNGLMGWLERQRENLRTNFQRLLEKLIQNEIAFGNYTSALKYSDRWHESAPEANLPLQYLIWLSAHLQLHARMLDYCDALAEVEMHEPGIIGHTAAEWKRQFDRGMKPDLSVLHLDTNARVDVNDLVALATEHVIGRDEQLERVFEALFFKHESSLITISGEKGMGKTSFARRVGFAAETTGIIDKTIYVPLMHHADFDELLSMIAITLDQPFMIDLDYRSKYLSVESAFKQGNYLLVIDLPASDGIFSQEFQSGVTLLSEQLPVLACTYTPWDGVDDIALLPITAREDIAKIFANYIQNDLVIYEEIFSCSDQLLVVTNGVPLALTLLASTIQAKKISLSEALQQIQETSFDQQLIRWCWNQIDEDAKPLLIIMMQFDLLQGPTTDDLLHIRQVLSAQQIDDALAQLTDLGLIEKINNRFQLHALMRGFLQSIDAQNVQQYIKCKMLFRDRFRIHYFKYLSQYAGQFEVLDGYQRNIARAFEYAYDRGDMDGSLVNLFLPYQLARGQYLASRKLLSMSEVAVRNSIPQVRSELLLNMAKLDLKQGEIQDAEKHLLLALELAEAVHNARLIALIHEQLALVAKKTQPLNYARIHLDKAEAFARQAQEQNLLCSILANRGSTEMADQKYDVAQRFLVESLELAQTANTERIEQYTLTALGVIALESLDFEKARTYLLDAQKIASRLGYFERQGYIYLNLGIACFYLGQYDDAKTDIHHALEIAYRLQHDELIATVTRIRARIEAAEHYRMKSEASFKNALILASRQHATRLSVSITVDLAKLEFQYHNWADAQRYVLQALHQAKTLGIDQLYAECVYSLCMILLASKWIIGPDNVEATLSELHNVEEISLMALLNGIVLTKDQLHRAAFFFQYGLENFPDLWRFRVVDALTVLLKLPD